MTYTKEQLADLHAAIDAHMDGIATQFSSDGKNWIDIASQQEWLIGKSLFRPKPEPKLRPWRADEVPVGAVVKINGTPIRRMIISIEDTESCNLADFGNIGLNLILKLYTLADGSPCGTTEP
jgi:hypothetical protein